MSMVRKCLRRLLSQLILLSATFVPPESGGLPQYSSANAEPGQIIYQTWNNGKVTISE